MAARLKFSRASGSSEANYIEGLQGDPLRCVGQGQDQVLLAATQAVGCWSCDSFMALPLSLWPRP